MSANKPITIQFFLPQGEPRGVRIADITTRIVQAMLVPRTKLPEGVQKFGNCICARPLRGPSPAWRSRRIKKAGKFLGATVAAPWPNLQLECRLLAAESQGAFSENGKPKLKCPLLQKTGHRTWQLIRAKRKAKIAGTSPGLMWHQANVQCFNSQAAV